MKVVFFLSVLFFQVFMCGVHAHEMVMVEADRLNLRSAPDRNASVVLVLSKGARARILGEREGWVRVMVGEKEGYLRDRPVYIRRVSLQDLDLEKAKKEREGIKTQIQQQERMLTRYREREMDVIAGLNAIDKTLHEVNGRLSLIQKEQAELLEQRKKTREEMAALERENRSQRDVVGKRLRAFYKLESTGRMALLGATDNVYEFSIHKRALEQVLHMDDRILGDQSRRILELTQLSDRLKKEEQRIADVAQKAADQLRIQRAEKEKRKALLNDIRTQQKHGLAAVSALEEVKASLDQTIEKLGRRKSAVSRASGGMEKFRGLLDLPVNGTIISRFGHKKNPKLNIQTFQSGIGIRADRGEPIRALFYGTVVYADWFSGYGNMIIIDHGDHYYSVYAHAEELFKKTGDGVERNEVIATVGDAGSLSGSMLHFEIRQQGKPVDPMLWVKSG
ncbi:peptidoglycan DD-metalloendopeptidase family protein [Desulfobotulus sp.]|jgi:septal ring factor EnvC (AmiA/AmiB activator)|uniref:peptidoglycan DD-metalloendopeptidase family protein n=1 Tax=Desulfobotulus sp. TaxID=1940337 RepID=UPI002A35AA11|nr:peptidoglycan DD-metalloendopeptidase family protein [Desulfobotulus sp.]MDY0163480.1 peptidoglycan DD-metalloendopeptidase family protein [Desulfobotulus sp.]